MTGLVYDDLFLEHGYPERAESPKRLRVSMQRLAETGLLDRMQRLPVRAATRAEICSLHEEDYLDHVRLVADNGGGSLDIDTVATEGSYDAAVAAAGSCIDAAWAVFDRQVDNALCLVRPPGHHALPERSLGFCIFNNVALAAEALLTGPARSVAIVDYDAHHGNGVEQIFYNRDDVLYISLHQMGFWPGTGSIDDAGAEAGFGRNLNIPMAPWSGDEHYARAFDEIVLPALALYKPDAILCSAGYDAHFRDPLPDLYLTCGAFYDMTRKLTDAAAELCEGRLALMLEGGYDLQVGMPEGVEATVRALMGLEPIEWTQPERVPHELAAQRVTDTLDHVIEAHRSRWLS